MAKRELSSTLKNLKFMQRAVQREEKPKEEEEEEQEHVKEDENFTSPGTQKRKCIVIMEGNPHPGALKGRMSFQSFNPSIDKLNGAAGSDSEPEVPATSSGDGRTSDQENGSLRGFDSSNVATPNSDSDGDHKRKQAEFITETPYPNKPVGNGEADGRSSASSRKGKKQKHEKLDWKVLRPPKAQRRQS